MEKYTFETVLEELGETKIHTKPTCEDMLTAAEWLDVNGSQAKDGDNEDEMASCTKVAIWLRANIEKADKKRLEETAVEEILVRLQGTGTTKQEARAMWRYGQLRKRQSDPTAN